MDAERGDKLRWKHILTLTAIGASALLLFLGYSAGRTAYEKHQRAKWETKYANGLWRCDGMDSMFEAFRRKVGAPPADLMVAIYPAFKQSDLIAITGNEVRILNLPSFPRERGADMPAPSTRPPQRVLLAPDLMSEVARTISDDVENVRAKPVYGLDGVSYIFFTASGHCGETWSPEENTRSDKLADLVDALHQAARSPEGPKRKKATERVNSALEALQD